MKRVVGPRLFDVSRTFTSIVTSLNIISKTSNMGKSNPQTAPFLKRLPIEIRLEVYRNLLSTRYTKTKSTRRTVSLAAHNALYYSTLPLILRNQHSKPDTGDKISAQPMKSFGLSTPTIWTPPFFERAAKSTAKPQRFCTTRIYSFEYAVPISLSYI